MRRWLAPLPAVLALLAVVGCTSLPPLPRSESKVYRTGDLWEDYRAAKDLQIATAVESRAREIAAAREAEQPTTPSPARTEEIRRPVTAISPESVLAVMDIDDRSGKVSEKLGGDLVEYFRSAISDTTGLVVIDRSRQERALDKLVRQEKRESYKACYDDQCQLPLGRALAADAIVRTIVMRLGSKLMITCEIVDLAREATVASARTSAKYSSGRLEDTLIESLDALAEALAEKLR